MPMRVLPIRPMMVTLLIWAATFGDSLGADSATSVTLELIEKLDFLRCLCT